MVLRSALVMVPMWAWETVIVMGLRTGGGSRSFWIVGAPVFNTSDPRVDKRGSVTMPVIGTLDDVDDVRR